MKTAFASASLSAMVLGLIVSGCSYEASAPNPPATAAANGNANGSPPPADPGGSGERTRRIGSAVGIGMPDDPPRGTASGSPPPSDPQPTVPPPRREGTILTEKTREVIDFAKAGEGGFQRSPGQAGVDPLTQLGTIGVRTGSFVGSLPVKQWISQHRALEGRYPNHAEVVQWMAENNFELPARYAYERYAYDATTGEFLIVENPQMKAQYLRDRGVE